MSVVRNTLQEAGNQGMKVDIQSPDCQPLLMHCNIINTEFGKLISPESEINIVDQLILQSWSFSHDDNSLIFF